ncbi:MAG: L,D-transpeptidase family protein [Phycisphaerae bacterium]
MSKRFPSVVILSFLIVISTFSPSAALGQTLLGASRRVATNNHAPRPLRDIQPPVSSARTAHPRSVAPLEYGDPSDPHVPPTLREAVAWQAALDRAGFSPGVIDGLVGPKTRTGLRAFQAAAGIAMTGRFDPETRAALGIDSIPETYVYTLTRDDAAGVSHCPADWIEKSRADWLGFDSLAAVAANRGHCSRKLLARLNPGKDINTLIVGDAMILPNVVRTFQDPCASEVEIDFGSRTLHLFDRDGRRMGLFHCSIARKNWQRPSGPCRIAGITHDPRYLFKPESWPEVPGIHRRLTIPPGPRNPVGVCWIGLSIKGYGIHGTPRPELIGKTGSHGCFRLTNWDILRLANRVKPGTPVYFIDRSVTVARGG